MNFEVHNYRIIGESEDGLSAGQLTTDQIFDYLQNCNDWLDECVYPLANELCDRLHMEFDFYDTYDELYDSAYNKMLDLIEETAEADFEKQDFEKGPIMGITPDNAFERLLEHRKKNSGIPLWTDEYINFWNQLLLQYILDDNLKIKPVRWCK